MINPDSVNSLAAAILPPRQDAGGNAEQKRMAWMLQMERALLAANQVRVVPDTAQATSTESAPQATRSAGHAAPRDKNHNNGQDGAPDPVLAGSAAVAHAATVAAPLREEIRAEAVSGQAPDAGSVAPAAVSSPEAANQTRPPQVAASSGAAGGSDAQHAALPAAMDTLRGSSLPADLQALQGLAAVPGAALSALGTGMLPLHNPYQSLHADPVSAASGLAVTGVRAAAPSVLWGVSQLNPQRPLVAGGEEAEPARAAVPDQPETESFAERKLHLYQGADGVQAWIRDADLNQMRAQLVAQALNSELNAAGLKLKTLTVNGRKLDATGGTADDADAMLAAQDPLASPPGSAVPVTASRSA